MSKFRAGGPRSASAPLHRHRAMRGEGSLSQDRVESDSESDPGVSSDSASPRAEQDDDSELLKADMPTGASAAPESHENMIDPALLALDTHDTMHQSMDGLDATDLGLAADAAAHSYLAENAMEPENADIDQEAQPQGKKRRHEEDGESSEKKRSKKEKGRRKAEDSTDAASFDRSSHTSGSADLDMDSALNFGSPSAVTLASEAAKDPFLETEPPVGTAEEKVKRKEEKRKRKEARRARKEAKRLSQAQSEAQSEQLSESADFPASSTMHGTFEY